MPTPIQEAIEQEISQVRKAACQTIQQYFRDLHFEIDGLGLPAKYLEATQTLKNNIQTTTLGRGLTEKGVTAITIRIMSLLGSRSESEPAQSDIDYLNSFYQLQANDTDQRILYEMGLAQKITAALVEINSEYGRGAGAATKLKALELNAIYAIHAKAWITEIKQALPKICDTFTQSQGTNRGRQKK